MESTIENKDIPKKPCLVLENKCPRCFRKVFKAVDIDRCVCGQKLDWSDVTEEL